MKNCQAVIDVLAAARSMELFSIQQYMSQHYLLDDWDYRELSRAVRRIAIDEMRHAEEFAERITTLGGAPKSSLSQQPVGGQTVEQIFPFDRATESDTIRKYNDFLAVCRDCRDNVSAELFEHIIEAEQTHHDVFDRIAGHISRLGNTYLAQVAGKGQESASEDD